MPAINEKAFDAPPGYKPKDPSEPMRCPGCGVNLENTHALRVYWTEYMSAYATIDPVNGQAIIDTAYQEGGDIDGLGFECDACGIDIEVHDHTWI